MKFKIFKYKNVTSTNDIAINLIKKKKEKIGCVCADVQTKGRGTHGKVWISSKGNLFVSLFFPLKKEYPPFYEFSIINPIIVSNVIRNFCKKKNISLKFPNDVFLNGKKVCGLLQEVITSGKEKFLIIGIGINIISNPSVNVRYKATNMFFETNKKISVRNIIKHIILSYKNFFIRLNSYNFKKYKKKAELMSLNYTE
tara:strand:- start:1336 stop:1929 length:594 start_codon:yes stop_codon:yes gene_type:complete